MKYTKEYAIYYNLLMDNVPAVTYEPSDQLYNEDLLSRHELWLSFCIRNNQPFFYNVVKEMERLEFKLTIEGVN